jgi:N12 class adenine-specific DNA methylase
MTESEKKLKYISNLAKKTARKITAGPQDWAAFLKVAAKFYKYSFQDQLLIYAQRPDATACAAYDVWNNRMNRWVKRGAKGIALLPENRDNPHIKYVFDVKDTQGGRNAHRLYLWNIKPEYYGSVNKILTGNDSEINFPDDLMKSAADIVDQEKYNEILPNVMELRGGSLLEEMDEQNVSVILRNILTASVQYAVFTRCGVEAGQYITDDDLRGIVNFNTDASLSCLGNAVAEQSKTLLRHIERTVKQLDREKQALENQQKIEYNEFGDLKRNFGKEDDAHGRADIQEERGLPDSGSGNGSAAGRQGRKIRDNERKVSERTPLRDLHLSGTAMQTQAASSGYRPGSGGNGGPADEADEETARDNRTAEGDRSDALGAGNEQHPELGKRNYSERPDLQLKNDFQAADLKPAVFSSEAADDLPQQLSLFPTEQEQKEQVQQAEDEKSSAFSIPQEDVTRALLEGGNTEGSKYRISEWFQHQHSTKETIAFLKHEYGTGGQTVTFSDGWDGDIWYNPKGFFVSRNWANYHMTWEKVAKQLHDLVLAGRYLTPEEQKQYNEKYRKAISDAIDAHTTQKIENSSIDTALQKWNGNIESKHAVVRYFEEGHSNKEIAAFLRAEYGNNLPSFPVTVSNTVLKVSWEKAYQRISRLILDDRFYTQEEQDNLDNIDPVTFKKKLAESGIVDGKVVDESKLENDPFIQQVRATVKHLSAQDQESPETENRSKGSISKAQDAQKQLLPHNFRITNDHLGEGGQKTKYAYNVQAIQTLRLIEAANRAVTPEEQETLSRYVGWGGIPQAFDVKNKKWAKEYAELKGMLSASEYAAARASVLNAHYTSPIVIKAIYRTLARFGFHTGNILEPACGIGNFFGLVPDSMNKSKLYGVELDNITGRIAKQLYPDAKITVDGFEKIDFPDNFFDLAVGNVPFGEYQLADRKYDQYKFLIHDYFFAKSLDKVRPGGLIAFITSKGTMDKRDSSVRRYISERAVLLGAVRLPNTAFLKNAGTEATSDILFLQKRESLSGEEPEWLETGETEDGVPLNRYFLEHPEMMLGKMAFDSRMFGDRKETTCSPIEGTDFEEQLKTALSFVSMPNRETMEVDAPSPENPEQRESIPADPDVRNFSFTFVDGGGLYFRENSMMNPVDVSTAARDRICGMVSLRDCTRRLIDMQMDGADDTAIQNTQKRLNTLYDTFTAKYGLINSSANKRAFQQDSSYCLLCSLEVIDEDGKLERKADMFAKRTIRQKTVITSVDTASEALTVSLGEKACVDLDYMASLLGGPENKDSILKDLQGVIFKDPDTGGGPYEGWVTADDYLSGNVRKKFSAAREAAQKDPAFSINVAALEKVQPKDLDASEIDVRLGATWVDPAYIDQFMYETFDTPAYLQDSQGIKTRFSPVSGVWNISGKGQDNSDSVPVHITYGTNRINAYKILEETLNLRAVRIFDREENADGNEQHILNPKETAIAQQKQEAIKQAFKDWIWKDPKRRDDLCKTYNTLFNSTRPREYDGSHLTFPGMNPEITLRPHQLNAVAHQLYGKNTLLAHCVGAGKTYEMVAAAMESKRLGLCHKSLFVVPNHLTEQWGGDFLRLYPGANILVATKKDFEPLNRKKFCARIATGDYDAVIIGHSQFEKIPVSKERQVAMIREQIDSIEWGIDQAMQEQGETFTIKQMEKTRKSLETKLQRLNDDSRKDDVVTFEELGADRLFVDEADSFKNLFLYTKMRNVAGIGQTEAQKSTDMYTKCRYMDELTGGRGITFATGTPISNSMTELYTMMRYLQYDTLQDLGLGYFDSWAAAFGETVTATELAPEGTGFRTKTRFAHFFNLPELMNLWKEAADIQTADMLNLPVPEAEYVNVVTEPSEFQKEGVEKLGQRAEDVRNRLVEPWQDNMLKITSDGRTLALDQRLMNPLLPDDPDSKVNACVKNILDVWRESTPVKGTQLVFCDLSTPKRITEETDETFTDVYNDIRLKLIRQGVPKDQIAFIHEANTEVRKAALFAKVRKGEVRVLLGSTAKMGAGTNVQDRMVAEHHLDCPWKPRDIEQREGRILRQGNNNPKVKIFRYVTKNTFDSYNWQLIENKQKFISQVMTSKSPARSCEDVDESVLSYAEVKALATGDPRIKEKMDLDIQVTKLKMLRSGFQSQHFRLEDRLLKYYPKAIQISKERIAGLEKDLEFLKSRPVPKGKNFTMVVNGIAYTSRKKAGTALINACGKLNSKKPQADIGEYRGFSLKLQFDPLNRKFHAVLKHEASHSCELGLDAVGNIARLDNLLDSVPGQLEDARESLKTMNRQVEESKEELKKTFPQEQELAEKSERLNRLTLELDGSHPHRPEKEESRKSIPASLSDRLEKAQENTDLAKENSTARQSGEKEF